MSECFFAFLHMQTHADVNINRRLRCVLNLVPYYC